MIRMLTALCLLAIHGLAAGPLRFEILLDNSLTSQATSGRMFVLMSSDAKKLNRLNTGFGPGATWIAAMEFENLEPGQTVKFDPDLKAYPREFSQAMPGDYQFMALLDQDHSYARANQDAGDLFSEVVQVKGLNPADA